jgi:hypothetical protein
MMAVKMVHVKMVVYVTAKMDFLVLHVKINVVIAQTVYAIKMELAKMK